MDKAEDKAHTRGVHDGQNGDLGSDFAENCSRIIPILPRDRLDEIRSKGYDYGAEHRQYKKEDRVSSGFGSENNNDTNEDSSDDDFSQHIGGIIVFIIIAYFFYWFLWGH